MAGSLGIVIASSASSGIFALAGAALTNGVAGRRERHTFRTETALELAGMERLVWGDDWVELRTHLQRQQARLAVAGVPEELISAFRAISEAAWKDVSESREQSGGDQMGMLSSLLDARESVHRAIRAELLSEGKRSDRCRLRTDAIAIAERSVAEADLSAIDFLERDDL